MHIFEAIIKDHKKVKELLAELVSLDDHDHESRNDLVKDIRDELVPHSRAEESVLYNSMRALNAGKGEVMHGYKEHLEAEALLRALQVEDKMHLGWKTTAQKLKDALEHHMQEEEDEIFAAARKVISPEEAEVLGDLFENMKPQIKDENILETTLEMMVNMMPPRLSESVRNFKSA